MIYVHILRFSSECVPSKVGSSEPMLIFLNAVMSYAHMSMVSSLAQNVLQL
jgi:hypothetical protein